ncbi:MAG: hypothetical protein NXI04_29190 [Planctomycetaceae bacterium]|nr:hypothetical protein [Planctomycetaceae bacterium]
MTSHSHKPEVERQKEPHVGSSSDTVEISDQQIRLQKEADLKHSFLRPALNLTAVVAAAWAVCFWPARGLNGEAGVYWMTIAAICCLVPGWIVVFLGGLVIFPNDLAAMLAQMAVRLVTAGAAALIVRDVYPSFGPDVFLGWLIGFYLLALFVEVSLLQSASASDRRTATDPKRQAA